MKGSGRVGIVGGWCVMGVRSCSWGKGGNVYNVKQVGRGGLVGLDGCRRLVCN